MTFLKFVQDPSTIITAIDSAVRFPEILQSTLIKYSDDIKEFQSIVRSATTSEDVLTAIRNPSFSADQRMSLLKIFRRSVSPVIDTEMAKKIKKVLTSDLCRNYGHTFKDINLLKLQFENLSPADASSLAALIGEYDTRGQSGYLLTDLFFTWFENEFADRFTIDGPRGAGRDIELSTLYSAYVGNFPCDFVIRNIYDKSVLAIGFARYDSTRGGGQSDDRTGGNSDKVSKAQNFCAQTGAKIKIIFLSDGPGLAHKDTWAEARFLDDSWNGNVRVCTLKTAPLQIDEIWLTSY